MSDQVNVKFNMEYASVKNMNDELRKSKEELFKIISAGGDATAAMKKYAAVKNDVIQFNNVLRQAAANTIHTTQASSNASMALLNLNYVVRDSPYFFQNFALGVLAVGNNLNPLIDSFARLREEAGQKSLSTFALLKQALVGGAGLSIAFSLVVTAIQSYVFWQAKASRETEATAKKANILVDALNALIQVEMPSKGILFKLNSGQLKELISNLSEDIKQAEKNLAALTDAPKTIGLEGTQVKLNLEGIAEEVAKQKNDQKDVIASLREQKKQLEAQLAIQVLLESKGLVATKTEKEKIKHLKEQKGYTQDVLKLLQEMYDVLYKTENLLKIPPTPPSLEYKYRGLRPRGLQRVKDPMEDTIRAIKEELAPIFASITQIANIAGTAISNAFLSGKNAIDAATQALKQFIVQLLVVQTLKGLMGLFFGLPFEAGFLSGIVPGMPKVYSSDNMNKSMAIRVTGKITADKNNFIANIRNADNYYSRNEEFVLIGR